MPENIITISERLDRVKRKAADTDCKLPPEDSREFLEELTRLLEKIEDHVAHIRGKNGIV